MTRSDLPVRISSCRNVFLSIFGGWRWMWLCHISLL